MKNSIIFRTPIIILILLVFSFTNAMSQEKPWQYLTKLFTEALGRIPAQGSCWNGYGDRLTSVSGMRAVGIEVYTSSDYETRNYDNASRILTLFRGALNREPNSSGFWSYYAALNSGRSWNSVVTEVFNSSDFNSLADSILNLANGVGCDYKRPFYGWGANPVIDIPIDSIVGGRKADFVGGYGIFNGDSLQELLNRTPIGDSVTLAQKLVIRLMKTLRIPVGVTLKTLGSPDRFHYAQMARLIRGQDVFPGQVEDPVYNGPLILMDETSNQSALKSVWIDGQRSYFVTHWGYGVLIPVEIRNNKINIRVMTWGTCEISNCRINDPIGFSNLQIVHSGGGDGIKNISYNLLTGYATYHSFIKYDGYDLPLVRRAEGIDIGDKDGRIFCNQLVDMTDVAICVFPAYPDNNNSPSQRSIVEDNEIHNSGNSAFAGIITDPLCYGAWPLQSDSVIHYEGTRVKRNIIWSSSSAHIDIGLSLGTRTDLYYSTGGRWSYDGIGPNFSDNTSGNETLTCNIGVLVNGTRYDTVLNNTINTLPQAFINIPEGSLIKNSDLKHASGNLQSGFLAIVDSCLYEYDHTPIYISGPTEIASPPWSRPQNIESFTWTAIKINDISFDTSSLHWTFLQPPNSPIYQTGGLEFTINLGYQGSSGKRNCIVQCNTGSENGQGIAKKYVTKYLGRFMAKSSYGNSIVDESLPASFDISQNYPNPFNPSTNIKYELPEVSHVSLKVYDVLGRIIANMASENLPAGYYEKQWDAGNMPSGIYFCRISVIGEKGNNFSKTIKMLLTK